MEFTDEIEPSESTNFPTISIGDITIENDNINENPEVFFLEASVETFYPLNKTMVCFKRHEKDETCMENGTTWIRIIDNDREFFPLHSRI